MDLMQRLDKASNNEIIVDGVSTTSTLFKKITSRLDRLAREFNPDDETAFLAHIEEMSLISFIEKLAQKKATRGGVDVEASSLEVEGLAQQSKDLDESVETDVFGLNTAEVREIFFDLLLKPILCERSIRITGETGKKGYACELCDFVAENPFKYTRHKNSQHTPWKALQELMKQPGRDMLLCPFDKCKFQGKTVRHMDHHMTGIDKEGFDKCPNGEEFRRIKADHKAALPPDNRTAKRHEALKAVNHIIPATNPDLIGLDAILSAGADGIDLDDPKWVTATTADWRSLQTVDFLEMDFDKFRSEPMDVDKEVHFFAIP